MPLRPLSDGVCCGACAGWPRPRLRLRAAARLDLDHLATAIGAARRADVMGAALGAAVRAIHELWRDEEVMAAAVALPRAADPLLGKSAHDDSSLFVGG